MNTRDVSLDKIESLINESTTEQLVPSFAFLGFWLSTNVKSDPDSSSLTSIQAAFHLIDLIVVKVPPVILLSGISELNWGMQQPNWTLNNFFQHVFDRLHSLRNYVKPLSLELNVLRWPQTYESPQDQFITQFPGVPMDIDIDPQYQIACIEYFKFLILSHAPIDAFNKLFEHRNSRFILTHAIISLISDLHSDRNATHKQLLFTFVTIFMYVQGFVQSNNIDGQILCEYIQSRPYVSPLCMLAIVNQIQPNIYIYNLLIPKELAKGCLSEEEAIEAIKKQYRLEDLSSDHAYDDLIKKVPDMVINYFLPRHRPPQPDPDPTGEDDIISYITSDNMKRIVLRAKDMTIDPQYVAMIKYRIYKLIMISFDCTFYDCCKNKMFTPTLVAMTGTILSIILPTNYDSISTRFFASPNSDDYLRTEFQIRAVFTSFVHIIAPLPVSKTVFPYLLKAIEKGAKMDPEMNGDLQICARLLLTKYLRTGPLRLTDSLINDILQCHDIVVILEYIDTLDNFWNISTANEYKKITEFRERLISLLPFTQRPEPGAPYIIDQFTSAKMQNVFDLQSVKCFNTLQKMSASMHPAAILEELPQIENTTSNVIRFLTMTNFMQWSNFASVIVGYLIKDLADSSDICHNSSQFIVRKLHLALNTAQAVLGRLIYFHHDRMVLNLLDAMLPVMASNDKMPLHWLMEFVRRYSGKFTPEVRQAVMTLLKTLPLSAKYLIEDDVKSIAIRLYTARSKIVQDPDILDQEYTSEYQHIMTFSACYLLLRYETPDMIAAELCRPIHDILTPWKAKDKCCFCLAELAAQLPTEHSTAFVKALLSRNLTPIETNTLRVFLDYVSLGGFKDICQRSLELIGGNERRLKALMRSVLSTIMRLKGDNRTATDLLKGILGSVNTHTDREVQEEVIDTVGLVYISLKLHKSRTELINASSQFPPEMKSIIASSLEVMPESGQSTRNDMMMYGSYQKNSYWK